MELVRCERIFRSFGGRRSPQRRVLDDVSFMVASGEIVGLLGPNGAGKTTLLRILSTVLLPDSGYAEVAGYDVVRRPADVKNTIGVVFSGAQGLFPRLSVYKNLEYYAILRRIRSRFRSTRIEEVLGTVDLLSLANQPVSQLSTGLRQRLVLARALLHRPAVLLLDEPTNGLDPVASMRFRGTLDALKSAGTSILFCSHAIHEVESLCDRVVLLSNGMVKSAGTFDQLLAAGAGLGVVEVRLPVSWADVSQQLALFADVQSSVTAVDDRAASVRLHSHDAEALLAKVEGRLGGDGIPYETRILPPTPEDVYMFAVNRHGSEIPS